MEKIDQLYQNKLGIKPEKIGPNDKIGKKGGLVWFW